MSTDRLFTSQFLRLESCHDTRVQSGMVIYLTHLISINLLCLTNDWMCSGLDPRFLLYTMTSTGFLRHPPFVSGTASGIVSRLHSTSEQSVNKNRLLCEDKDSEINLLHGKEVVPGNDEVASEPSSLVFWNQPA